MLQEHSRRYYNGLVVATNINATMALSPREKFGDTRNSNGIARIIKAMQTHELSMDAHRAYRQNEAMLGMCGALRTDIVICVGTGHCEALYFDIAAQRGFDYVYDANINCVDEGYDDDD